MARHLAAPSPRDRSRRGQPALLVSLLLIVGSVVGLRAAVQAEDGPEPPPVPTPAPTPAPTEVQVGESRPTTVDWVSVLEVLDRRRARAFAAGDARLLDEVYAPGSRPGAADAQLLEQYADRGLRVTGLRMRLLDVRLLHATNRRAQLRVVDRLVDGRVRASWSRWRPLPEDRVTARRITLAQGQWPGWRITGSLLLN